MLHFLNFKAYSQSPPRSPAKQWQKSFNQITYKPPAARFYKDWTLDIIQTPDDSYIGVGFAGAYTSDQKGLSCTVNYNPAIYKLNGSGGLIWQKVEDDGHPAPAVTSAYPTRTDVGRFLKVIEVKEVGQDHYCYVAVGHKPDHSFSSAVNRSFICKYDEDGNLIGTVHYINLNASTITGRQPSTPVTHYVNGSGQDRYLFTGYKDYKMILFQTDNSFTEQPLATEVNGITINDNLPGTSTPFTYGRGFEVKVSYTYPTSTTLTQQNDAYTCKYNLSGVKQWGRVFASGTSDYWGGEHTKFAKREVKNSFTDFIANLPKERANKLTDEEILQLRNIAKVEPDYAIYAQNLISLNTGEIFKRLPIIANSQSNGKVSNNNEHHLNNNNLSIYPNPTSDNITVVLKDNIMMEGTLIEIYDYSGKRVLTKGLDHSFENIVLNVNQLSSGVYLLLYITESQTYNSKFIIQK